MTSTIEIENALTDLVSRFLLNLPMEELSSMDRIFFQIEQAHWFYEDFMVPKNPSLPRFTFKAFVEKMFIFCPLLKPYLPMLKEITAKWNEYKAMVPSCGVIMVNQTGDMIVLVKGAYVGAAWGFPKGKINKDEDHLSCAIREVFEETGFDCAEYIEKPSDYIQKTINNKIVRLYIALSVPESTAFITRTRKEIEQIGWHPVEALPKPLNVSPSPASFGMTEGKRIYSDSNVEGGSGKHKYWNVKEFVPDLIAFLKKRVKNPNPSRRKLSVMVVSKLDPATGIMNHQYPPIQSDNEDEPDRNAAAGSSVPPEPLDQAVWPDFRFDRQSIRKSLHNR
eukprot:comp16198_c0_seq1/m.25609 comp16198_c0_seq1/g.25609  ORF comp16198_c0_seq1/g.25609 comp16198_c0_seq1/m.25609 type:complete len:336 (-) comp16198_c0_seq1:45-1052(-)